MAFYTAKVSQPPRIRVAVEEDVAAIFGLIVELAVFEREPDAVTITPEQLRRDGWGAHPAFDCLIAEDHTGQVCGFALYHPIYSTWQGRSLYLEDLYVQPGHRGRGVGSALLARVAAAAIAQGCARLDWSVLTWNEPALAVYARIGAVRMEEWRRMRLAGDALHALAGRAARTSAPPTSQKRDVGHPRVIESPCVDSQSGPCAHSQAGPPQELATPGLESPR